MSKNKSSRPESNVEKQQNTKEIDDYLSTSEVLKRSWSVKIDPFKMVMALSTPISDDLDKLKKMMEKAGLKEVVIDPNDSVLALVEPNLLLTINCQYGDISTFKAAASKWGLSVGPSILAEAANALMRRAATFTEMSQSLKSRARLSVEARLAERDALQHRAKSIGDQMSEINGALEKSVIDMIREERLLAAVTWEKASGESTVNIFRHVRCPELNPLTSLMGIVDSDNPTIKLSNQVRISSFVPIATKVVKGDDGRDEVLSSPPLIIITHRGSFLEASAFVKEWGIKWVEIGKK